MHVNLYQSDVSAISDDELKRLSGELFEAYCGSDEWGESWCDDDAEARYYELRAELDRRYPSPRGGQILCSNILAREILERLSNSLAVARFISSEVQESFVGDTVTGRKPYRFTN